MWFIVNVTLKSLNLDIMEYESSFNVKFLERILTLKALVNISIKSQNQLILIVFCCHFRIADFENTFVTYLPSISCLLFCL